MDLIADIGATNSRCALLDRQGQIARSENFRNSDYARLPDLLDTRRVGQRELCGPADEPTGGR